MKKESFDKSKCEQCRNIYRSNPNAAIADVVAKVGCNQSTAYKGKALARKGRRVKRVRTRKLVEHVPLIIELDTSALLGGLQLRLRNGQGLAGTLLVSSDQKVSVRLPNQRDASIGGAVTLPLLGRLLAIGSEL